MKISKIKKSIEKIHLCYILVHKFKVFPSKCGRFPQDYCIFTYSLLLWKKTKMLYFYAKNFLCFKVKAQLNLLAIPILAFHSTFFYIQIVFVFFIFREIFVLFPPILFFLRKDFNIFHKIFF